MLLFPFNPVRLTRGRCASWKPPKRTVVRTELRVDRHIRTTFKTDYALPVTARARAPVVALVRRPRRTNFSYSFFSPIEPYCDRLHVLMRVEIRLYCFSRHHPWYTACVLCRPANPHGRNVLHKARVMPSTLIPVSHHGSYTTSITDRFCIFVFLFAFPSRHTCCPRACRSDRPREELFWGAGGGLSTSVYDWRFFLITIDFFLIPLTQPG